MKTLPLIAIAGACALAGCTSGSDSPRSAAQNDPYETTNRSFYASHQVLYKNVIRPVAVFYTRSVPEPARDGLHNFLVNVDLPVTFGNDLLQGEALRSGETLARFTVNTTAGIGGVLDVAKKIGIPEHETGFADTLADYGVGEGAYLYVPVIGPTVPRELAGKVADSAFDPLTYVTYGASAFVSLGRSGATFVDKRSRGIETADAIERTSPDPYATTRLIYEKHLAAEANHTAPDSDFDGHPEDVRLALAETQPTRAASGDSPPLAAADLSAPGLPTLASADSLAPQNTGAYCAAVASARADDAAANGIEPDVQQVVYDGAYKNCAGAKIASNTGSIQLSDLQ